MSKRTVISLLIGVNVVLLGLLLGSVLRLPQAFGQLGGRAGGFACVSAKASGQSYDVLYALDSSTRKLHAFHPANRPGRKIEYIGSRDLAADFGRTGP